MSLIDTMLHKAKKFADSRASAGKVTIYKNGNFIDGYRPRLAGKYVSLGGDSFHTTRESAIIESRLFKIKCMNYIKEHSNGRQRK